MNGLALFSAAHDTSSKTKAEHAIDAAPMSQTAHGKAVPFPYVDKKWVKDDFTNREINGFIESAPKRVVDINGLHAIQHSVKADRVKEYVDDPHVIPMGQRHPTHRGIIDSPIVMQYKGKRLIWDGHHRITAEMLTGRKNVVARFVDLDAVKKV